MFEFGKTSDRYLKANSSWLEENILLPDIVREPILDVSLSETSNRPGRPQKDFRDSSMKTKKSDESNNSLEHQARKSYQWQPKYNFARL